MDINASHTQTKTNTEVAGKKNKYMVFSGNNPKVIIEALYNRGNFERVHLHTI